MAGGGERQFVVVIWCVGRGVAGDITAGAEGWIAALAAGVASCTVWGAVYRVVAQFFGDLE